MRAIAQLSDEDRRELEEFERREVARRIRALISATGLTQKEFAEYVGTSGSRLSTYVNGRVMPSAAMMLRMERVAELLRRSSELAAAG